MNKNSTKNSNLSEHSATSKKLGAASSLAQMVVAACVHFKIEQVVISPGSRNAPLTIGFAKHPKIEALSVVDERCAAFFALGIAQQMQKPVVIVCTSGSALLNYYPAIAEAFYSKIPLVVISADRPKHLIDIGDGQTIRQENVFKNHILFSANLDEKEGVGIKNSTKISEAIQVSIDKRGPIHINVPFDEPLYEIAAEITDFEFNNFDVLPEIKDENYLNLSAIWSTSPKRMIIIGSNFPDESLNSVIQNYSEDNSVLIFSESQSNIHIKNGINSIDQLISLLKNEEFIDLKPDLLITLGGMIVSKQIKSFLRKYQPKNHWHIDELIKMDTYFCLTEFIKLNPVDFFTRLKIDIQKNKSDYQSKWLKIRDEKRVKHQQFVSKTPHSDLKVFSQVLEHLPTEIQVQLSNSSVIRYAQLFSFKKTQKVFCNRGTSGIDGSTSTAIGAAFASKLPTVLITGDVSFFYDSNALWNSTIKSNFRIIVINNKGGGIFKIIPGPSTTNAIDFFETPHQLTAEHLCKMYGFEYQRAINSEEVNTKLNGFFEVSKQPKLLEIFTPSEKMTPF